MSNEFQPPSYERYLKATAFARFRYKYGLVIVILAWITLLALLFFVYIYSLELSTQPLDYLEEKYNVSCYGPGDTRSYRPPTNITIQLNYDERNTYKKEVIEWELRT